MSTRLNADESIRIMQRRVALGRRLGLARDGVWLLALALSLAILFSGHAFRDELNLLVITCACTTHFALRKLYTCPTCKAPLIERLDEAKGPDQVIVNRDGTHTLVYGPPADPPQRGNWRSAVARLIAPYWVTAYPRHCPNCGAFLQ